MFTRIECSLGSPVPVPGFILLGVRLIRASIVLQLVVLTSLVHFFIMRFLRFIRLQLSTPEVIQFIDDSLMFIRFMMTSLFIVLGIVHHMSLSLNKFSIIATIMSTSKFLESIVDNDFPSDISSYVSDIRHSGCRSAPVEKFKNEEACGNHSISPVKPCGLCLKIHYSDRSVCYADVNFLHRFGSNHCAVDHIHDCFSHKLPEIVDENSFMNVFRLCVGGPDCKHPYHPVPVLHLRYLHLSAVVHPDCSHYMCIPIQNAHSHDIPSFWNFFTEHRRFYSSKGAEKVVGPCGSSLICADDYEAYIRLRFGQEIFVYASVFGDCTEYSDRRDPSSSGSLENLFQIYHHCRPVSGNLTIDCRTVVYQRCTRFHRDKDVGDIELSDTGEGILDVSLSGLFDKRPPRMEFGPVTLGEFARLICFGHCNFHKRCKYYQINSPVYPEPSRNSGFSFNYRCLYDTTYLVFPGSGMFLKQFKFDTVSRLSIFEQLTVFSRDSPHAQIPIGADTLYCGVSCCCLVTLLPDDYPDNHYCPEFLSPGLPSTILFPGHVLRIMSGQRFQVAMLGGILRVSELRDELPLDLASSMYRLGAVRCFIPRRCDFCVPYGNRPAIPNGADGVVDDFVFGYGDSELYSRVVYLK